ncbi:hypothetical protein Anas_08415 [Armadillidium nasatum]|uniref:ATPase AAA-type core domain-containing protein n=1 Tax=Armadillidium nasatum TaxID=96803 RepID=A0A5N5TDG5_9CRUS|nr:hypothetical protein Anas_08415 [Armadillidium nasatum]
MHDTSDKVIVKSYKTVFNSIYQACCMPDKLMKILKFNYGDVAYLKVDEKGLICQVLPKVLLNLDPDFEVIASYQVMHNVSHLKDFHSDKTIKISMNNITPLIVKDILEINISIVMVSVDSVVKARKCYDSFKQSVKSLLKLYKVMDKTIISCLSNPMAEFLGIAYITINNTSLSNKKDEVKFIGRIITETGITISSIESEERHLSLVKNYSLLGGLEPILTDLKNMVFCCWNDSTKMKTSAGGVLLVGPPGCGKSSLVQQLCYETKASYISTAAAELQSPYEGETFKNFKK